MNSLYNKLSIALDHFLKDRQAVIQPSPSNTFPLFLVLIAKPDLVAFATLDGKPKGNYSMAFQKFKDLYSIHSNEWANFDLTLVLCKGATEKNLDDFYNEIEVDPYFCRKFVIDIDKELEVELGRLPFVPLRPESIVGLKRPTSAQTFLMEHGVNTNLARYLVIPHARGKERIIEECIEGVLGKPKWIKKETKEFLLPHSESRLEVSAKNIRDKEFPCL